jgi:small multidrug resistance pump
MPWLVLAGAILSEMVGTLALRDTTTGWRLLPTALVVVGYGLSFVLLAIALRSLNVGPVYAIWSGVGTAGVTVAAALLYDERVNLASVLGMALIVLGVVVLALFGGTSHA